MDPFEKHAAIELLAEKVLRHAGIEPAILLETAYRKTIQQPPQQVINSAAARWQGIIQSSGATFDDAQQAYAVYRRMANDLWKFLSPEESRAYLLKAKNQDLT